MSYPLSPSTISPPPSPSSNSSEFNNISILYYAVVVVGTAAIVLTLYNLIIIKRRHDMQLRAAAGPNRRVDQYVATSGRYKNSSSSFLLSSFKYNKKEEEEGVENECAVCLSVFEEGEEVRKLPRCNHSFHALCIDMWLYSHVNCPVCRTAVGPPCRQLPAENGNASAENSREGLLVSGMSV